MKKKKELRRQGLNFLQFKVPRRPSRHNCSGPAGSRWDHPPLPWPAIGPGRSSRLYRARGASQPGCHEPNSRQGRSSPAARPSGPHPTVAAGRLAAAGRRSARAWDAEGLRAVVAKVRTSWKMSSGHAPQRPLSDPKPTLWSRQPGGMGPEHCRAPHAQRGP